MQAFVIRRVISIVNRQIVNHYSLPTINYQLLTTHYLFMRKINYIVVHCSATREGHVLTPEALESEHRRRGFRTTGYHYYIRRDGTVLGTRSLELPGAHCRGHNKYSIGICYEGGLDADCCPKDTRTLEQRGSLLALLRELRRQFPKALIVGHHDLNPMKECPCFSCTKEYSNI